MTLLGLDFDNTLVCYDKLFKKLAVEKGLIDNSIQANKTAIRNHLCSIKKEGEFTLLQGEVYGKRIKEAEASEGMIEAVKLIINRGIKVAIVSHKTKEPYKGPKYNLHEAALKWIEKNKLNKNHGLNIDTYFEPTKKEKIERIKSLQCDYYVDDLFEILEELPGSIKRIHYSKQTVTNAHQIVNMNDWRLLKEIVI